MEEIKANQKKEIKTFENDKRTAMKKVKGTAGKGKKGKEALVAAEEEWETKFQQLSLKHEQELTDVVGNTENDNEKEATVAVVADTTTITTEEDANQQAKEKALAKKIKKRQNALQQTKAREEQIAKDMAEAPDQRQMEIDVIMALYLLKESLEIEEVAADGNCMYRAVAKQMELISSSSSSTSSASDDNSEIDFMKVRQICAQELGDKREEYEPFADLGEVDVESFEEYIEKVRDSSEWGGHLELRALAHRLKKTIVVYSTERPLEIQGGHGNNDDVDNGGDGDGSGIIRLSFHRKYYALGEHYNSVVAKEEIS